MRRSLRNWPAAIWLVLAFAGTLAVAIPYVLAISTYTVMPDELGYMKQAVHFGDALRPSVDGDMWFNSYAQLGPLLFAPGYAFWPTPTAFDVAHIVSAVTFASAVFPVYLLTRWVTGDRAAALIAAVLAVAVPWLGMTATLMTEPIAYPAFVWSVLAICRAIERRTPATDGVALAAIAVATLARTQLVILGVAFVAAAAIVLLREGNRPAEVRAALHGHRLLLAVSLITALAVIVTPSTVLGSYADPLEGDLVPPGMFAVTRELLAYVAIGAGVVTLPLALAFIGLSLWRPATRPALIFAAVALSAGVMFALTIGSVNTRYAGAINDRYLCFLAPILIVASMSLLVDSRPAVLPLFVGGALSAALFATADLLQSGPSLVAPTQTFMPVLNGRSYQLGSAVGVDRLSASTALAVGAASAAVLLALTRLRLTARPLGLAVGVALIGVALAQTLYDLRRIEETQAGVSQEFLNSRGWVDHNTPGNDPIGLLLGEVFDPPSSVVTWWDTSFWSARIDRVWALPGTPTYEQPFVRTAEIDERTGRIGALDGHELIAMSASERRFDLAGAKPLTGFGGVEVVRVDSPVRVAWTLGDETAPGFVPAGEEARLRVYGDGVAGTRDVALVVVPATQAPGRYRARLSGRRGAHPVAPGAPTTLRTTVTLPAVGYRDLVVGAATAGKATQPAAGGGVLVAEVRITKPGP